MDELYLLSKNWVLGITWLLQCKL